MGRGRGGGGGGADLLAHLHQTRDLLVLQHHFGTALSDLREADECSMPLLPPLVSHQLGQGLFCQGHHGLAPESQGNPVKAFLPELIEVPFTLSFILLRVSLMPLSLILE